MKRVKKLAAVLLAVSMLAGLSACGPKEPKESEVQAQNYTGTAKGFGGDVTVTLSVSDGKITKVTAEGKDETPDVGGKALEELAGNLLDGKAKDPAALRDALLHTIACKAAIKAGWHTEPAERASLVKQVMERDDIKYCPHGRPVITTLTKKQLEKQFKR